MYAQTFLIQRSLALLERAKLKDSTSHVSLLLKEGDFVFLSKFMIF